jgi:outer membrane receptor protein involved in Fe transport
LTWVLGLFVQHRDYDYDVSFPSPGFDAANGGAAGAFGYPDNLGVLELETAHNQTAIFGDLRVSLSDSVEFSAGTRFIRHKERLDQFTDGLFFGGETTGTHRSREFAMTPKISLIWKPLPNQTYYATVSSGYAPGGPNRQEGESPGCAADLAAAGYDEVPDAYHSTELVNHELGMKRRSMDGRTALDVSVFYIAWSRLQQKIQLSSCGASFAVNTSGRVNSRGVELEFRAGLTDAIDFGLRGSVQDVERRLPGNSPISGVPDFNGAASLTWQISGQTFLRLDHTRVGSSPGDAAPFGFPMRPMPGYSQTNFTLVHTYGQHEWHLRVDNLTDAHSVIGTDPGYLGVWDLTLPPRMLTLGYRWAF